MSNRREVETLLAVHRVMVRHARALAARLDDLDRHDPDAAGALARWFHIYRSALDQHHEVEDEELFPLLAGRDETFAAVVPDLALQHDDLHAELTAIGDALAGLEAGTDRDRALGSAREAAGRVVELLEDHIPREERHVVPVANQLDDVQFRAIDEAAAARYPLREALMTVPWMIDDLDPTEKANLYGWQPRSVKIVYGLTRSTYRRRVRAAGVGRSRSDSGRPKPEDVIEYPVFDNTAGLPDELVPVFERTLVCEFASMKRDGVPVTTAVSPTPGTDGRTVDVNTGLAFPAKAERARQDPRVCLLFSEPEALPGSSPPVVLVYGHATVMDRDLQAGSDRYVEATLATTPSMRRLPGFVLKAMRGYFARIWVAVTPLRVLWWPDANLDGAPRRWDAPATAKAPPSDPAPMHSADHAPIVTVSNDRRASLDNAIANLGRPILTTVDQDGYPVPFRTIGAASDGKEVRLDLFPHAPRGLDGPACLSFHTLTVKKGELAANENRSYLGAVRLADETAHFTVDRELPTVSFRPGVRGNLNLIRLMFEMSKRLEPEAARRGQPVPEMTIPRPG